MIEVVWLIIGLVLIVVGTALAWRSDPQRHLEPEPLPADPVLENKPDTILAQRVWAAHVATQELDLAVLTGTADQVKDAETKALAANSHLIAHLSERAAQ